MQQDVEKALVRDKQARMNIVGGEYVLWPAAAEAPILIDNTQLQQRVLSTSSDVTVGLLLGSSYRRLDKSANPQLLQVLDATAYVVHQDEKGNVSKMGLAVADGAGGHYGDAQQDQQIATVAKRCCELALKQLTTYSDVELCYQALPSIVKTIAKDIQDERLTESCSLSALVAFVGKKHLRVVGFGIGDCLLAAIDPQKGTIETLCPAHESRHGSAMYPASYKEFEVRYFQKRLSKDCMLLGMSDGLWAGLPHLKTTAKYDNGLEYEAIQLDTNAINIHLHPSKTLAKGALCYDALTQLAIQNLNTQRQTVKAQWEQAVTQKAALPSVHYGDDGVLHMLQIEPNIYSLQFFNNSSLIPDALKTLNQPETQQDSYAWQNQLFALLKKEPLGSLAWCYGLCLLSHKVMQKASRDRLQESYINGMKYATAALKNARCLTGQLLAKTQIQEILKVYINKELALKSDYPLTKAFTWQHQLIAHRQLLQQKLSLLRKDSMSELLNYHQQFLNNFIHVQWQSIQQQAGINFDHQISLVSLGSLGRGEAAPYSDFEFAWLVDDKFTQEKRSLLEKLTEWWFLQVITLGETKTIIAEISKKPLVESGFTFDMDLGGLCPLMERQLINTPQGLAQLQENADEATFILRNALISCGFIAGSRSLFEGYKKIMYEKLDQKLPDHASKGFLSKKERRGQVYGKAILSAALRDFAPSSINEDKERQQALGFNVKREIYRLPSQVLTGLSWYYQCYQSGAVNQLEWLHQHKKLHSDGLKNLRQLFNEASQWRYRSQLFYGYEFEILYHIHDKEQSSSNELKYILTHQEIKNIQELYRILIPLEQIIRKFLQDKAEGKLSLAFKSPNFYSQEANTLAIAQARTGNYQAAEQYYAQAIALKPNDKYLFLQRLQNLGQHYEQIRTYLREQAYQENSVAKKAYETQLEQLKDKAINILQLLLNLLCKDKNIVTSLEEAYQQIPLMFRESFRVALLKVMDKKPEFSSELQASFKVLHRYPDVAGERLQWLTQKNHWQQLLMQCIDEKQPAQFQGQSIILSSSLLGRKFLSSQIAAQLLDNGEIKKQTISRSSHTVIRIKLNEEIALYAKVFPEMPGMTYLIEQLHSRLIGHGVSLSELVKIEVPHKGMIPLILSQEVMGPTFDEVLRGDAAALARVNASSTEEALLRLDKHHMMGLMLVAMLTNPEDGIPANFIYHLLPNGQATLVSVDHDHALFPAYLGEELQVKTILFCLPLLKEALPESLKKELLAIDPGSVLRAVLRGAQQQNKSYGSLFSEEEMKKWHQQRKGGTTTIPIPIKKGDATKLYFKLLKLQTLLKEKPQITGLECLLSLEPRVGSIYAKALVENKTPQQLLQEIGRYTADKKGSLISQTAAIKTLQLASTLMTQPEYAQLADLSPEEGLAELDLIAYQSELVAEIQQEVQQGNFKRFQQVLNSYHQAQVIGGDSRKRLSPLSWTKLSAEQQRALLDICKGITFEQLDLSGCMALTDVRLQILLMQSPDLVSLTLSEYTGFSEKTLHAITTYCPSLNRLCLVNFPTWTGEAVKKIIVFSLLTELELSNFNQLSTVPMEFPQLQKLNVINCPKLSHGRLISGLQASPLLSHVQLEQCELVSSHQLAQTLLNARGFTNITLPLASLLITDQQLDLSGLEIEPATLINLIRTYPQINSIFYPQIASSSLRTLICSFIDEGITHLSIQSGITTKGSLKNHKPVVTCILILRNGRVLTGSKDGSIKIWDLNHEEGQECLRTLTEHKSFLTAAQEFMNGWVVSGSADGELNIWDLSREERQECIRTIHGPKLGVISIEVLANNLIVTGSIDGEIKVWDLNRKIGQECLQTLLGHEQTDFSLAHANRVSSLRILADGCLIAGFWDGVLKIWEFNCAQIQKCLQILHEHKGPIIAIQVLGNGRVLTGSSDGTIKVWNLNRERGLEYIKTLHDYKSRINSIQILSDGNVISCSVNGIVKIWDLNRALGQECLQTLRIIHKISTTSVQVLNDSRVFIHNTSNGAFEIRDLLYQTIHLDIIKQFKGNVQLKFLAKGIELIYDTKTELSKRSHKLVALKHCLATLFSDMKFKNIMLSDNSLVLDNSLLSISTLTTELILLLKPAVITGLLPSTITDDDLKQLLPYGTFSELFFDMNKYPYLTSKCIYTLLLNALNLDYIHLKDYVYLSNTLFEYKGKANSVQVLEDGRLINLHHDYTIKVWAINQPIFQKCMKTLQGHKENITYIQNFPDGRLVSGSEDCTIRIWDLNRAAGQECLRTLYGHEGKINSVQILSTGKLVSSSYDGSIKVWDLSQSVGQECIRTLQGHKSEVTCTQIMSDDRIVSGSADFSLKVWDLTKSLGQECVQTLYGHEQKINAIKILPVGLLVTASDDNTLKVWNIKNLKGHECVQNLHGHTQKVNGIGVISDSVVVSASDDKTIKVWDLRKTKGQECTQTLHKHKKEVFSIQILTDGRLITGSANQLKIWDLITEIHLASLSQLTLPLTLQRFPFAHHHLFYQINMPYISSSSLKTIFETLKYLVCIIVQIDISSIENDIAIGQIHFKCGNLSEEEGVIDLFKIIETRIRKLSQLRPLYPKPSAKMPSLSSITPGLIKHSALWKASAKGLTSINNNDSEEQQLSLISLPRPQP